jgi:hypothetical protein
LQCLNQMGPFCEPRGSNNLIYDKDREPSTM